MRTVAEGFVDVPDGYLYYRQYGHGPDVVLLNAGLADVRMWDTTVAWLADIARVTTWDYRDTGLSSWSSQPYSEIDDLEAVLDAVGVSRATLVGVSDGGRQALAFAHRHPDRVAKVCVVGGSFGKFPDPSAQETAARQQMRTVFAEVELHLRNHDILAASVVDVDAWSPAVNSADRRRLIGWHVANARILMMDQYHGGPFYARVRGTDGNRSQPGYHGAGVDPAGPAIDVVANADPWTDLWFYTNPIFVVPR